MSTNWYENFGFLEDPYYLVEPWVTPFKNIEWNRGDLEIEKNRIDDFIEEVKSGYNTSILIWGAWRSGKSWLGRIIQKQLIDEKEIFFIMINIEEGDPSQSAIYLQFIKRLINKSNWINLISEKVSDPTNIESWQKFFESEDLGRVL